MTDTHADLRALAEAAAYDAIHHYEHGDTCVCRVTAADAVAAVVPALLADLDEARRALWSCPECAFTFDAFHTDPDGSYSCPLCAETALAAKVEAVRALADAAEHGALRWEHPLPVPEWVARVRHALGDTP